MRICSKCKVTEHSRDHIWCAPCHNAYRRARYAADPTRVRASGAKYKAANREKMRAYQAQWQRDNPEWHNFHCRQSYLRNPETTREYGRKWREQNPAMNAAKTAKRRAAQKKATPVWLTAIHHAQIQEFYEISAARTTQTGINHEVDHVCPLQGKHARGLHVPWNLQVLTERENISKGNRL